MGFFRFVVFFRDFPLVLVKWFSVRCILHPDAVSVERRRVLAGLLSLPHREDCTPVVMWGGFGSTPRGLRSKTEVIKGAEVLSLRLDVGEGWVGLRL